MTMQDPVADMLTRIRNAQARGIQKARMPYSSLKNSILLVLKEAGYIDDIAIHSFDNKKDVEVTLKYFQGRPVIEKIKRVSKPAMRVYRRCEELPLVRGGLGIAIISTPKGVMTDKAARTQNVGGEILCTVE
jgi:small subunit ribosomal protein S8